MVIKSANQYNCNLITFSNDYKYFSNAKFICLIISVLLKVICSKKIFSHEKWAILLNQLTIFFPFHSNYLNPGRHTYSVCYFQSWVYLPMPPVLLHQTPLHYTSIIFKKKLFHHFISLFQVWNTSMLPVKSSLHYLVWLSKSSHFCDQIL